MSEKVIMFFQLFQNYTVKLYACIINFMEFIKACCGGGSGSSSSLTSLASITITWGAFSTGVEQLQDMKSTSKTTIYTFVVRFALILYILLGDYQRDIPMSFPYYYFIDPVIIPQ